jgi:hypothetical protein
LLKGVDKGHCITALAPSANPVRSSYVPDSTIETDDPVVVSVESENLPAGTIVMVEVHGESLGGQTFESSRVAGARIR